MRIYSAKRSEYQHNSYIGDGNKEDKMSILKKSITHKNSRANLKEANYSTHQARGGGENVYENIFDMTNLSNSIQYHNNNNDDMKRDKSERIFKNKRNTEIDRETRINKLRLMSAKKDKDQSKEMKYRKEEMVTFKDSCKI